jgi:uncharacterized protein (DUF433 family)
MDAADRIEVNPAICGGKPVIRGMVAGGYAIEKILAIPT